MPQNEIANSPSTPVCHADAARTPARCSSATSPTAACSAAFLEKVDGEYQGAVFRHDAGPRGRRQPGHQRPRRRDLRRRHRRRRQLGPGRQAPATACRSSTPNGSRAFDMLTMERRRGRLRDRLHPAAVRRDRSPTSRRKYKVKQWRYAPTAQYGGPKVDEESLTVTARDRCPRTARRSRSTSTASSPAGSCTSARRGRSPRHGRDAVEHRGLVHAQQLPRLRRARARGPGRRHLRARGGHPHRRREVRHRARRLHRLRLRRRHPDHRLAVSRSTSTPPRPAPTTWCCATPTARTRSPTRRRR